MVTENVDPVSAYDSVAPSFALLAAERQAYLDAVDRLVIEHLPASHNSLLDVGAGDARRARLIAAAGGCARIVLVEPSAGMRLAGGSSPAYLDMRAENLDRLEGRFDIILCLWNVLGHLFPASAREELMRQFRRLLRPEGRLFVDVNHRYNAARYGWLKTAGRCAYDLLRPSGSNGDVVATWRLENGTTSVRGHVFTASETERLVVRAGLIVERRFVLDYETGELRKLAALGNLLYIIRPGPGPS